MSILRQKRVPAFESREANAGSQSAIRVVLSFEKRWPSITL